MKLRNIFQTGLVYFMLSGLSISCKKFVEVDAPRTDLTKSTVFTSDVTAKAAILDIYYQMLSSGYACGDLQSLTFFTTILSDEQINYVTSTPEVTAQFNQFYENTLTANNPLVLGLWAGLYSSIYKANAIIEGLSSSSAVTESLRRQLEGEAKFIRAFCHFYLVNLWGDIPLVTTTDYRINNTMPRTNSAEVYAQIIADLKDAENLLVSDFSFSNGERVRANKGAAIALLARVYLYNGEWSNAEMEATKIITNSQYGLTSSPGSVFNVNSTEAILQLWSTTRPKERATFRFTDLPILGAIRLQYAQDFESGDNRRTTWINLTPSGYYSSFKYTSNASNPPAQYSTVLRLAEQYLIRAEARAKQGKITGLNSAESDINIIRSRAGLSATTANTQPSMLLAIEKERKSELFAEWGHRWLDLKRTGRSDAILGSIKTGWTTTKVLFPIPEAQIVNNPTVLQNPGY